MGQRRFSEAIHLPAGHAPRAVKAGDLGGDGDLDIATANGLGQSVSLLLNAGGRRFERVADLVNDGGAPSVALGDVDLDGDLDLVTANGGLDTVSVFLNHMTRPASRDEDSDGVPDECGGEVFVRGDCDGTSGIDLTDAVYVLNHAFLGGRQPPCLAACDANGDGHVSGSVTDAVHLLNHAFLGGPPPRAPYPDCGAGADTDRALGCREPPERCRANG